MGNIGAWSESVIEAAQRNIGAFRTVNGKRRRIDSSGRLRNSLGYLVVEEQGKTVIKFTSDVEYAVFVNEGVNGTDSAYTTRFSYGSKQPPIEPILKWMKEKPLRLRQVVTNENGQRVNKFVKATEANKRGAAFAIARNIRKHGVAPSHFMTEAVEEQVDGLADIMGAKMKDIIIKNIG